MLTTIIIKKKVFNAPNMQIYAQLFVVKYAVIV